MARGGDPRSGRRGHAPHDVRIDAPRGAEHEVELASVGLHHRDAAAVTHRGRRSAHRAPPRPSRCGSRRQHPRVAGPNEAGAEEDGITRVCAADDEHHWAHSIRISRTDQRRAAPVSGAPSPAWRLRRPLRGAWARRSRVAGRARAARARDPAPLLPTKPPPTRRPAISRRAYPPHRTAVSLRPHRSLTPARIPSLIPPSPGLTIEDHSGGRVDFPFGARTTASGGLAGWPFRAFGEALLEAEDAPARAAIVAQTSLPTPGDQAAGLLLGRMQSNKFSIPDDLDELDEPSDRDDPSTTTERLLDRSPRLAGFPPGEWDPPAAAGHSPAPPTPAILAPRRRRPRRPFRRARPVHAPRGREAPPPGASLPRRDARRGGSRRGGLLRRGHPGRVVLRRRREGEDDVRGTRQAGALVSLRGRRPRG